MANSLFANCRTAANRCDVPAKYGDGKAAIASAREQLTRKLPAFKLPRRSELIADLPRTATSKIQCHKLRSAIDRREIGPIAARHPKPFRRATSYISVCEPASWRKPEQLCSTCDVLPDLDPRTRNADHQWQLERLRKGRQAAIP